MSKLIAHKPFSCLVNTSVYRKLYARKIRKEIAGIEAGGIYINIETTNACNADCLMCPHSKMKRSPGTMNEETFRKIVDNAAESGLRIREFVLSGFGEPFADKNIFDRIAYVKSKGPYYVKIFSNAALLTPEKTEKLLASGLDEIVISFNGITKAVYESVMKLTFEKSLGNVLALLEARRRRAEDRGRKTEDGRRRPEDRGKANQNPKIVLSCVRLAGNKAEVAKFNAFGKGKADGVLKPIPENWSGSMEQDSPWKYDIKGRLWPCRGMWDTLDFTWDGKAILCCRDYDGRVIIGDIYAESVDDILARKRKMGVRQLENGDFSDAKICKSCDTMNKNNINWL